MSATTPVGTLSRARLSALLERMRGRRIAVVGDVMLDRYLSGDERLSPEAPVPIVTVRERRHGLGGAANVAANAAALGAQVTIVGLVGDDAQAGLIREAMRGAQISDAGLLTLPGRPTILKTRVMVQGKQVVRIDEEEDGFPGESEIAELTARALAAVREADALLLEDYDKGALAPSLIRAVIEAARGRGIPVVVDPKHRSFFEYRGATLFKPNRREFQAALPDLDPASADDLRRAVERLNVEHLLLTLGAEGMVVAGRGMKRPHRIGSLAREVFDVSGAGDTVTAWAGAALAAGASVVEAAEVANVAASIEVGKAGVATVSPEEVVAAHGGAP